NILGIPKPNLNILLYVSAKIAYKLIAKKNKRKYLRGKKRDIHEKDINYLKFTEKIYLQLYRLFPKEFLLVNCLDKNGRLLSKKEISKKIWEVVERKLI
ncbi:hypothetical protein J7K86_00790, partial [bacterium]|nr:hypothetical protein [bacterium]